MTAADCSLLRALYLGAAVGGYEVSGARRARWAMTAAWVRSRRDGAVKEGNHLIGEADRSLDAHPVQGGAVNPFLDA